MWWFSLYSLLEPVTKTNSESEVGTRNAATGSGIRIDTVNNVSQDVKIEKSTDSNSFNLYFTKFVINYIELDQRLYNTLIIKSQLQVLYFSMSDLDGLDAALQAGALRGKDELVRPQ